MRFKSLMLVFSLLAVLIAGGAASGQCVDDWNNLAVDAVPASYSYTISDWVCPDDSFDYYVLEVPEGAVLSGTITLDSPQTGTEFKLNGSNTWASFLWASTDATHNYVLHLGPADLLPDTYYMRVTYYSNYAYDHEYTITFNLVDSSATSPGIIPMPNPYLFSKCPWPTEHGNSRNNRRSAFEGPSGMVLLRDSLTMSSLVSSEESSKRYKGLIVGPDNQVFFRDVSNMKLYAYGPYTNTTSGFTTYSHYPPCLDKQGRLYVIVTDMTDSGGDLLCSKDLPTEYWRQAPPAGVNKAVMAAGDRIYTSVEGTQNSVQAWYASGNQVRSKTVDAAVVGVAESPISGDVFVQTEESLYKFDSHGNQIWRYAIPEPSTPALYGDMDPLGPVIGNDGRVWINDVKAARWYVVDTDGTTYKDGDVAGPLTSVAVGSNGCFYKAYQINQVACYLNWNSKVWKKSIPDADLGDLTLDSEGRVYIAYRYKDPNSGVFSYRWQILDPSDGSEIYTCTNTGVPQSLANLDLEADLAIGEDYSVILLNHGGFLGIYKPLAAGKGEPHLIPGLQKRDIPLPPGKYKKPK